MVLSRNTVAGRRGWLSLAAACALTSASFGVHSEDYDVRLAPAFTGPQVTSAHFNAAERAGDRIVVAGQSGIILYSDDEAATWKQAEVPVSLALTGVAFADELNGWAVGHDLLILHTIDGGESWEVQHFDPEMDMPLLDVWFRDTREGFAIGSRGYVFHTTDGGKQWDLTEVFTNDDLVPDAHLFSMTATKSGNLFMTAEVGALFRSEDDGQTWEQLESPYHGSFFGVAYPCEKRLVAYAMLGNAAVSDDGGQTWHRNDFPVKRSMLNSWELDDGTLVVMGLAGRIVVSKDCGQTFVDRSLEEQIDLTAGLPLKDGRWLFTTTEGLITTELDLE